MSKRSRKTDQNYQSQKRDERGHFIPKDERPVRSAGQALSPNDIPKDPLKDRGIVVDFGSGSKFVRAGRYIDKRPDEVGVKMAAEIPLAARVRVDCRDFSVPDTEDMYRAVLETVLLIETGLPVYVGCMGGQGRTGLMLACLDRVQTAYQQIDRDSSVEWVRRTYHPHAVETEAQERMVDNFDTDPILAVLRVLQEVRQDPTVVPMGAPGDYVPGFSTAAPYEEQAGPGASPGDEPSSVPPAALGISLANYTRDKTPEEIAAVISSLQTSPVLTPYGEWYANAQVHLNHLTRFQRWAARLFLGIYPEK